MRNPIVLAGAVALAPLAPAFADAPDGWAPLLEPAELAAMLEAAPEVRVLQVNDGTADGFIPGAVQEPYAEWRGPAENPGALPEIDTFRTLVDRAGIAPDTPVVVVHAGTGQADFGSAARVYWKLKSLGVEDLAVLNGGLAGWKAEGLPVAASEAEVAPSGWAPELSDRWRITSAEIRGMIEAGDTAALVDARPPGFFEGLLWHDAAASPGTLPGASNLTYDVWFEGDRMVDAERARAIAEEAGATEAPLTVSFCNTGHWAAINWFALSELAGIENTRLYAESMVEWSQTGGPMDNQPGRLQFYWRMFTTWVGDLFA